MMKKKKNSLHQVILWMDPKVKVIDYTYSPRNAHFGSWKRQCYSKTMLIETPFIYIGYSIYIYI